MIGRSLVLAGVGQMRKLCYLKTETLREGLNRPPSHYLKLPPVKVACGPFAAQFNFMSNQGISGLEMEIWFKTRREALQPKSDCGTQRIRELLPVG